MEFIRDSNGTQHRVDRVVSFRTEGARTFLTMVNGVSCSVDRDAWAVARDKTPLHVIPAPPAHKLLLRDFTFDGEDEWVETSLLGLP